MPSLNDQGQGIDMPGVVPVEDDATASYYQSQGWLIVTPEQIEMMAEQEGANGLEGFWDTLWRGVKTPFKWTWSGVKWLAVQPIHGFKWVWNKTKGVWEQQASTQPTEPGNIGQPEPKKAGMLTNPVFLIGAGALAFVLWKMYKKEPIPFIDKKEERK